MMKPKKLTEEDWRRVFQIRCRSKQGQLITSAERKFCEKAFQEDFDRYSAMDADVFDATVPFGSNVKYKR